VHFLQRPASAGDTGPYAGNIRRFYLYAFFFNLQLWIPTWVLYLNIERGLTLAEIALLEAIFHIVTLGMEIPTGAVADRWGRRTSIVLGAIGSTVSILLFGLATGFWGVLIS
jgi:MFS family permease